MSADLPTTDDRLKAPQRQPFNGVLGPALKVGAACGAAGFLVGGTAGIVKDTAPFLFGLASAAQTFVAATSFWTCRGVVLQAWDPETRKPSDLVKASAISGGLSGGFVGLLFRGRSNAIPGVIMFSLFGGLGQATYNRLTVPREIDTAPKPGFWKRMSEKRFSPVTVITNEQYAEMLREKVLKVDVEISLLDDRINDLKRQGQRQATEPEPTGASTDK